MVKLTLMLTLLVTVTLGSCTYDAGRLLPPAVSSVVSPDASGADKQVILADAGSDGRDAIGPRSDAGDGIRGDAYAGGTRAEDAVIDDTRAEDAVIGDTRAEDAITGDAPTADTRKDNASADNIGRADKEADSGGEADKTTFVQGRGQGALSGYGYASLGAADSLTSPTCGGMPIGGLAPSMPPVTFGSTCRPSDITWSSTAALCASGRIPGWSSSQSYGSYLVNWGIMIGVGAKDPVQALGVTYKSVALTVTGSYPGGLVAVAHLAGDDYNRTYCAWMRSGVPIRLSSFNTECNFGSGTSLDEDDVQKIDKIGVQVPPSQDAITLSDFCLTQIDLGK
jgi:hypothetical protein